MPDDDRSTAPQVPLPQSAAADARAQQPAGQRLRCVISKTLQTSLIAEPLRGKIEQIEQERPGATALPAVSYEIIIEVNLDHPAGRASARDTLADMLRDMLGAEAPLALSRNQPGATYPYLFAKLTGKEVLDLLQRDDAATSKASPSGAGGVRLIHRIWESQTVHPLTTASIRTVKANAAHSSFGALGKGVVWAVMDSGVDATHPHFAFHQTLTLEGPLAGKSQSFRESLPWDKDVYGHGTHVAGIIAGEADPATAPQAAIQGAASAGQDGVYHLQDVTGIRGMAPLSKLLILRVLDDDGDGDETALISAIEYVQQLNDYGRYIVVHGVNISAGFPAHPTWYGCGQTPLCTEINRLVKSGVAVVVAAGNSGNVITYSDTGTTEAGQTLSINDPGNAALAITVGSTHRESPHTYGVSYFSSKGPTSDGRRKPELVAPGEKVISAASSQRAATTSFEGLNGVGFGYLEDTGTSMAAPHVSGVVAAFLSVKREFIGQPEQVRTLLMDSAMDLGRDANFQGAGLVDLMKLIQSV